MKLGPKDYYKPGDWNALCDGCSFKYKASELKLDWQGFRKCPKCWEPRHPQDLIRTPKEDPSVPWSRPPNEPLYAYADGTVTADGSALADGATLVTEIEVAFGPVDPDSL